MIEINEFVFKDDYIVGIRIGSYDTLDSKKNCTVWRYSVYLIAVNGSEYCLGVFSNKEKAECVRNEIAKKVFNYQCGDKQIAVEDCIDDSY